MIENIFTVDEQKSVEELARKRGFKTVRDYMHSLIDRESTSHGETPPFEDVNDDSGDVRAAIQQGYRDVLRGDVLTEEEF